MDSQTLKALLTRYQNGEATDDERAQVEAWYDSLDGEVSLSPVAADRQAFVEQHWQQLATQISPEPVVRRLTPAFMRMAAAAVVLLTVGLGWYFFAGRSVETTPETATAQSDRPTLVSRVNESTKPLRVALSDGSTVTLQPGSEVQYPERFTATRREVRLVGKAFFEVARNPERPFLVYGNGMVTKVLGTSFTVIAQSGKPTAEVIVRTGRVAVYRQDISPSATESDIVLKPNEKATFYRTESRIVKALADQPVVLRPEAIKTHFVFDDTPVSAVFRELNDVYGVRINFDEQTLAACTLTANLANQPLRAQLDMICLSIGATYQIAGTSIQINSRGCP